MPDPSRPSVPWRTRAFRLTRNRRFLLKGVLIILGVCALLAAGLHRTQTLLSAVRPAAPEQARPPQAYRQQLGEEYRRLDHAPSPEPERLAQWLRRTAGIWQKSASDDRPAFDSEKLKLGDWDIDELVKKHATAGNTPAVFKDYVRARFGTDPDEVARFRTALQSRAMRSPPVRFAGEFAGDLWLTLDNPQEALAAYMRDTSAESARYPRRMAVGLALRQTDTTALRSLAADPRVLAETGTAELIKIAQLLDDKVLVAKAILGIQIQRWSQPGAVGLTLLAAAVWYFILIHTGSRALLAWLRYLPAVGAGVLSVLVIHWMQITLDYSAHPGADENPTSEMLHWILYVGIPEEAAKLLLFAAFLPALLHRGSARQAALTAGCVGLGFALNENIVYFTDYGIRIATSRLLTANFLHIALTGYLGWHLYELFRSRFHHASNFLTVFAGASVGHGLYNFASSSTGMRWEVEIISYIILAFAAKLYFQSLRPDAQVRSASGAVSRTCVFWFGSSLLTGLLMIATTWELGSPEGISWALKESVALIPVAFIYLREFDELE